MRRTIPAVLAALVLVTAPVASLAEVGDYKVVGVEPDDMLKMRAGPGVGFRVIVGLPNGTVLRVHGCEQTGGTRWCRVSLKEARTLRGYVSWTYLQEL
jgi:uncharacterized protein YraI